MDKDDFMNDLYDYLWMPEEEQGALYLHQNILFGRAADEEKIACATLPYLFRLGITPQMRGYEILCRAVILYLLDGIQNSTHLSLLMTIAVERGTSLTSVERACAAAVRYICPQTMSVPMPSRSAKCRRWHSLSTVLQRLSGANSATKSSSKRAVYQVLPRKLRFISR